MVDLKLVFKDLDRLQAPVTWSDVKRHAPSQLPESERPRRVLIAGLALAIAAAGVSLAIRAFVFAPTEMPSSGGAAHQVGKGASSSEVVPLPTSSWTPGAIAQLAEQQGVVDGSATLDGGCVWLEGLDGSRVPIVWPAGYQARFQPELEILDGAGTVEAKGGQTIDVSGGLGPAGDRRCMFGQTDVFYVQSAVQVVGDG